MNNRKIVIVNQAVNYLTIGICNEFINKFECVHLITGSVHVQGEALDPRIKITSINKWREKHGFAKAFNYLRALVHIYFLLLLKYRKFEVFFISVPPMAYLLNLGLPNRFSMLIWDVYPDVFKITGMQEQHLVYRIWSKLNKKSFKKAYRLFTIGERMADLLSKYTDRTRIIVQPIWSIFQNNERITKANNHFIEQHQLQGKFIVQYSGNIGLTHNVEVLVDLAESMSKYDNILFQIIGRGPRKEHLEQLVRSKNLGNCQFLPFQSDEMFPFSLSAADLGVVILDEKTSKGSVPSKSYNLMSYGIPSLYFASEDSELMNYANMYGHAKCFSKTDLISAEKYILKMAEEKEFYDQLAQRSLSASRHFKRENAGKYIELYCKE